MFCRSASVCMMSGICALGLGCGSSTSEYKDSKKIQAAAKVHDHSTHDGAHLHYGAGPHGGMLLELGGEDFHAELVFDHDAHAVRIFLFKADAKTPLPSKTPAATLLLDNNKTITLKALPLEGEADGMSSRFELIDEAFVHEVLDKNFLHGDLKVDIDGIPFKSHLDIHFDNAKHEHKAQPAKAGNTESVEGSEKK